MTDFLLYEVRWMGKLVSEMTKQELEVVVSELIQMEESRQRYARLSHELEVASERRRYG